MCGDGHGKADRQRGFEAQADDLGQQRGGGHVHERNDPAGQRETEALATEIRQRVATDQPESSKP